MTAKQKQVFDTLTDWWQHVSYEAIKILQPLTRAGLAEVKFEQGNRGRTRTWLARRK